jgi:aminotransferase
MPDSRHWISENISGITVSAIKEMAMRGAEVPDAASLTWGLPSFRTPPRIRQAVQHALEYDPDIGKYSLPDGLPELRAAVATKHERLTGISTDADRNVFITCGNMQALNALFHVILDTDDEIILTDPGFASHFQQIRMCGGTPVSWPLDESRGWSLDVDALTGLISQKTRAILLVTPSNPTGSIFSEEELRKVADTAI